ncbi:phosphatase PAP2 family protein [Candidatus Saccharibacteria bacterium]|nr:phosphatase PAP2 family protein [Candidatus Saccharibacteria bacterium]
MNWETATNITLIASMASLGVFALLGLYQLIIRKSLKKVDKPLLYLIVPLILMVITYFIFDKLLILNTRPDGSGEASFPSTHVMVVATIFACLIILLPRYIASKPLRLTLTIIMLILIVLTSIGRVLANKHWPSDVAGALIFSAIFTLIYYILTKTPKGKPQDA